MQEQVANTMMMACDSDKWTECTMATGDGTQQAFLAEENTHSEDWLQWVQHLLHHCRSLERRAQRKGQCQGRLQGHVLQENGRSRGCKLWKATNKQASCRKAKKEGLYMAACMQVDKKERRQPGNKRRNQRQKRWVAGKEEGEKELEAEVAGPDPASKLD